MTFLYSATGIEYENKILKYILSKNYVSLYFEQRLVDVFTNMDMTDIENSKDLLGTTWGVKGGEFYTPESM